VCSSDLLVLPVVNIWFQNRAYGGMAIILGIAIIIMPYLEHDKSQAEILIQEENINFDLPKLKMLNEFGEEQESKLNDISLAHGLWQLDSSNSIVEFQIEGTDGVTDGFFKRLKGSTEIGDSLGVIKLDIEIPIAGISTYNKTRDKSIRKDEDFFDEAKYPVMRYVVNGMRVVEDNYVAVGAFTMRGVSLPLETNMMFSGQGTINGKEVIILEGSGILDRTAFGQMPDATIGNELKFSYKVIFNKK
jgi:polyisoprenoid-binding protein YceI